MARFPATPTLADLSALIVGEWLDLSGCTGLTALPDGLSVGKWLDLSGCTGLTNVTWFRASGDHLRIGPVVTLCGVDKVCLGCFLGPRGEAVTAIRRKYGDGSEYEANVVDAFDRHSR